MFDTSPAFSDRTAAIDFQAFFLPETTCHREAPFAEAIFSQARDGVAKKRSQ